MEGFELIECLRHAEPRPRNIAISGCSELSESVYLPITIKLGAPRVDSPASACAVPCEVSNRQFLPGGHVPNVSLPSAPINAR
jgi:hypothetical protein